MRTLILRRIIVSIPLLLSVSLLSFYILQSAPGDPVAMFLQQSFERAPQHVVDAMRERLGLNRPIIIQYLYWLREMLRGNFGVSLKTLEPVSQVIMRTLPASLLLMVVSFAIASVCGIALGVYSALRPYRAGDQILSFIAFFGYSIPNFWLGLILIYVFSFKMGWLPSSGMVSLRGAPDVVMDRIAHLIMPVATLAFHDMVVWLRYQRSALLGVLGEDYIRTAKAKGLAQRIVVAKHALRNALIPVVTLLGLSVPRLLTGSYIVEYVFAWPGMGRLAVDAIYTRDYPVIMAILMISAVLVVLGNLLADVGYALVDPRINYGTGGAR